MDVEYFKEYSKLKVQKLLLEDESRVKVYKEAILRCKRRIEGKVVLDVGSGTGILSVFCAQAGAKKVHAVEATTMAKLSREVIEENDLSDRIEVHHCLLQDLELAEKVDVIVSEWMGFFLFHEGMLSAVIEARDRFLKPDGLIIPESADLYVAPCRLPKYFDFWDDVYGVKMETLGKLERENQKQPEMINVPLEDLIAEESVIKSVLMKTVTWEEVREIRFKTVVPVSEDTMCQGLCFWFVCNFSVDDEAEFLFLSTKPGEPETHWKQTTTVFPFEIPLEKWEPFGFELVLRRTLDFRKYSIEVTILDPEKEEHPTPCRCNMTRCVVIQKYIEERTHNGGGDENVLEDCIDEKEGSRDIQAQQD